MKARKSLNSLLIEVMKLGVVRNVSEKELADRNLGYLKEDPNDKYALEAYEIDKEYRAKGLVLMRFEPFDKDCDTIEQYTKSVGDFLRLALMF